MSGRTASGGTILSWTLFDFANTGYYTIIITLVYPIFFTNVVAGGDKAYWGLTISLSMLLTALLGPLLGSVADVSGRKKTFLGLFTALCIAATGCLYFTGQGTLALAMALVVLANMGFEGGTIFYDAFLPDIAQPKDYAKISGYGFANGYFGSFVILALIMPIIGQPEPAQSSVKLTFLIAAAFFGVFSIPLFLFVKSADTRRPVTMQAFSDGYRQLFQTFRDIRRYSAVTRFLLAFFVYNDSILTVLAFAAVFAKDNLHMGMKELIMFLMLVQGTALVGSVLFGRLTAAIGARACIMITLGLWVGVVTAAFFVQTVPMFFVIGAVAGIGLGASQSASRTLMALLTPAHMKSEFFGFYDGFFGKASAIVGPVLYGFAADYMGDRPAMLLIGGLFLLGVFLMLRVPDVRPEHADQGLITEVMADEA